MSEELKEKVVSFRLELSRFTNQIAQEVDAINDDDEAAESESAFLGRLFECANKLDSVKSLIDDYENGKGRYPALVFVDELKQSAHELIDLAYAGLTDQGVQPDVLISFCQRSYEHVDEVIANLEIDKGSAELAKQQYQDLTRTLSQATKLLQADNRKVITILKLSATSLRRYLKGALNAGLYQRKFELMNPLMNQISLFAGDALKATYPESYRDYIYPLIESMNERLADGVQTN